jgi:hypothetical protein
MTTFVNCFDPTNSKHVLWLKDVDTVMEKTKTDKNVDYRAVVNNNPMGITVDNMVEWAYTHFQLCMKYTQSVLRGKAFIPKP